MEEHESLGTISAITFWLEPIHSATLPWKGLLIDIAWKYFYLCCDISDPSRPANVT
jgi:hypothetical protein